VQGSQLLRHCQRLRGQAEEPQGSSAQAAQMRSTLSMTGFNPYLALSALHITASIASIYSALFARSGEEIICDHRWLLDVVVIYTHTDFFPSRSLINILHIHRFPDSLTPIHASHLDQAAKQLLLMANAKPSSLHLHFFRSPRYQLRDPPVFS